jgi:heme A synthase
MINLLIYLIIICLVLYVLWWVLSQIPLPQPIRTVAVVIFALVAVIMLLNMTGGLGSFHLLR